MKGIRFTLTCIASIISLNLAAQPYDFDPEQGLFIDQKGQIIKDADIGAKPVYVSTLIEPVTQGVKYKVEQLPQAVQTYIVELKPAPLVNFKQALFKQEKVASLAYLDHQDRETLDRQITAYQTELQNTQQLVASDIKRMASQAKIIDRFDRVSNAAVSARAAFLRRRSRSNSRIRWRCALASSASWRRSCCDRLAACSQSWRQARICSANTPRRRQYSVVSSAFMLAANSRTL